MKNQSKTRVFLVDAQDLERSALRLTLENLKMEMAGEATDWVGMLANAPASQADMLLVDYDLLPPNPEAAMRELRLACPNARIIILIGKLDHREETALSAGADGFISKGESPERVVRHLVAVSEKKGQQEQGGVENVTVY